MESVVCAVLCFSLLIWHCEGARFWTSSGRTTSLCLVTSRLNSQILQTQETKALAQRRPKLLDFGLSLRQNGDSTLKLPRIDICCVAIDL